MSDTTPNNTIIGILISLILGAYAMIAGIITKMVRNNKNTISSEEFANHKASVQYKDNCGEIVKRIEGKIDNAVEVLSVKMDSLIERGKK